MAAMPTRSAATIPLRRAKLKGRGGRMGGRTGGLPFLDRRWWNRPHAPRAQGLLQRPLPGVPRRHRKPAPAHGIRGHRGRMVRHQPASRGPGRARRRHGVGAREGRPTDGSPSAPMPSPPSPGLPPASAGSPGFSLCRRWAPSPAGCTTPSPPGSTAGTGGAATGERRRNRKTGTCSISRAAPISGSASMSKRLSILRKPRGGRTAALTRRR
jgi:hypothetical protein